MSFPDKLLPDDFIPYQDNDEPDPLKIPVNIDPVDDDGVAIYERPITDHWINNEVCLPRGERKYNDKVIGRSKDKTMLH